MATEYMVICEETGWWATAVRRFADDLPLSLLETGSLSACIDLESNCDVLFLIVEVRRSMLDELIPWTVQVRQRWKQTPWVAVTTREMRRSEWFLREAGAAHVLFSPRQIGEAICMLRRHLYAIRYRPRSRVEQAYDSFCSDS